MIPNPLHPAVLHFPIVLMFLLPLAAAGAIWAIWRGARPVKAWSIPLAFAVALTASSAAALLSGQQAGERAEKIVPENAIENHEEAAERFLVLGSILLGISAFGLIRGNLGAAARALTVVGSIGVAAAGIQVGAQGGKLVYEHNAGAAYGTTAANASFTDQQAADKD